MHRFGNHKVHAVCSRSDSDSFKTEISIEDSEVVYFTPLIFYISCDENNSRPDGPTLIFYISCDENNSRPDGPTLIFYISCVENNSRPNGPTLMFYISCDENNSRPDGPILIFYKYPVTKTTLTQINLL